MVIKVNQVANENHVKFYVNLTTPLHAHFMCILFECSFSILNFTTPIHGLVVVVATYSTNICVCSLGHLLGIRGITFAS